MGAWVVAVTPLTTGVAGTGFRRTICRFVKSMSQVCFRRLGWSRLWAVVLGKCEAAAGLGRLGKSGKVLDVKIVTF